MPTLIAPGYSAAPATPPSGSYLIYFNSTDGALHIVNSSGTDTALPTTVAGFQSLYDAWLTSLPALPAGTVTTGTYYNNNGVPQKGQ